MLIEDIDEELPLRPQMRVADRQSAQPVTLAADREAIDAELGFGEEVDWDPNPDKLACRIAIHRPADIADRDSWPKLLEWLKVCAETFKTVFATRVREMELPSKDVQAGVETARDEGGDEMTVVPAVSEKTPGA